MWLGFILIMIAVPLMELALLIKLGQTIGFWATIALLLLSAGVGFTILNSQGLAAFRRLLESMSQGKPPVEPVLDGFMLMLAGGLLIAPGLLTDIAGLLLLIPPVRRAVAHWGLERMMASGTVEVTSWRREETFKPPPPRQGPAHEPRPGSGSGTVIEGEFERIDEKPAPGDGKAPPKS